MKAFFINPPYKAEYGKFSRESRSPSIGRSGVCYYPLWLIYAAAVVEKNNIPIEFLDAPSQLMNDNQSLEYVKEHGEGTQLFVLDTSTPSIESDVRFAEKLKELYPESFILLVGTHPSATTHETLNMSSSIDGVARGEYDYIVRDLAIALQEGKPLSTVAGLSYKEAGNILDNVEADHIQNLDEIPFAAKFIKEHLNIRNYFFAASAFPEIQIFTGRGCPARCYFCVYPQTLHGHNYRLRSAQNVVDEMIYIAKEFPDVKEIVIEDDTFTVNKQRVIEICNLMMENNLHKRFRWLCNARVNLDLETMKAMKKAGCRLIIPGIESANQQILKNIQKGTTVEQIERYIKFARKAGLMVHACYMVGNMGETKETMNETLELAMRLKTDTAQFFPLQPYPGTVAYNWAKESNVLTAKNYTDYCKEDGTLNCVINLPEVSSQELVDFCSNARKKYYIRPWYICHRLYRGLFDFEDLKRSLKAFGILKKSLFGGTKK